MRLLATQIPWRAVPAAVSAVLLALASGAQSAERLKGFPRIGMGPLHIIASPDPLFSDQLDQWVKTREAVDFYQFNWKQLNPARHVDQPKYQWGKLTPGPFVRVMKKHGITYGAGFNQFLYALGQADVGKTAAQLVIKELRPLLDAGGQLESLHIDGPFRTLVCGIYAGKKGVFKKLTVNQACEEVANFIREIHRAWPKCKVGLTGNLPNWRYSRDFDFHCNADYTTGLGGVCFKNAPQILHEELVRQWLSLGFVEVDFPFRFYNKEKRNPAVFRDLQAWCRKRGVGFHMVVNDVPCPEPQQFYDGTLAYLDALHREKIQPDLLLIQSWYPEPKRYMPETDSFTMTGMLLMAVRKIQSLYGKKTK